MALNSQFLPSIFQPTESTLNIEPRCKPRPFPKAKENWLDEFRSQTRKDRIKWDTKLYSSNKKFHRLSLYEQIDELVDVAANEFAEWINRLGSDDNNRLNCETIKQLFSIGIEDDVSRSISICFKHRPAISSELAEMFDCPEVPITIHHSYIRPIYNRNIFSAGNRTLCGASKSCRSTLVSTNRYSPSESREKIENIRYEFPRRNSFRKIFVRRHRTFEVHTAYSNRYNQIYSQNFSQANQVTCRIFERESTNPKTEVSYGHRRISDATET